MYFIIMVILNDIINFLYHLYILCKCYLFVLSLVLRVCVCGFKFDYYAWFCAISISTFLIINKMTFERQKVTRNCAPPSQMNLSLLTNGPRVGSLVNTVLHPGHVSNFHVSIRLKKRLLEVEHFGLLPINTPNKAWPIPQQLPMQRRAGSSTWGWEQHDVIFIIEVRQWELTSVVCLDHAEPLIQIPSEEKLEGQMKQLDSLVAFHMLSVMQLSTFHSSNAAVSLLFTALPSKYDDYRFRLLTLAAH